jgi:hypothetical protein
MEAMRVSWTDERLDDFKTNVDQRFDRVEARLDRVEQKVDDLRGEMQVEFRTMNRTMLGGFLTLFATIVATSV